MEQTQFVWPLPKERADTGNRAALKSIHSNDHDTPLRREEQASQKRIKAGTKAAAVLKLFVERGELGLNCFEAVRLAHDYVLRTSVSNLTLQYGLVFNRRFEQVPGHGGSTVECVRYRLSGESRERACELVGLQL